MNKYKKKKLKRDLIKNKGKIITASIILFVVLLGVGYAASNQILHIGGYGRVSTSSCDDNITGSLEVSGAWPGAEILNIKINNYEQSAIEDITIEMSVPDGTSLSNMSDCVVNTVDNSLYPDANGMITITFSPESNCLWISSIPAATSNNGSITPTPWAGGNGFSFQLNNDSINTDQPLYPTFVNFNGCTIYGNNGNQETPLTALGLSPASSTIGIGESVSLTTTKTPSYKQVSLTYTSSDTSVATVDSSGVVTGVGAGEATITVSAEGITASATVTVEEVVVVPTSITINPSSYRLFIDENVPLQTTMTPDGVTSTLTWTSSDSSIATVDSNGNVIGISEGNAVITVTTENGVTGTCNIRVVSPASGNNLEVEFALQYEYTHGDSYMFTYTLTNNTDERITYFKIGVDLPTTVTYNLWQANVSVVDGNYFEMITNDYTYIEPNSTFTIQGVATFPDDLLEDGTDPWGNTTRNIPSEYLDPVITSVIYN